MPEGQVGVGIEGGLEAAIHAACLYIQEHELNEDLCLLKVDFTNAFNECDCNTFLHRLYQEFPEIFSWVYWCYSLSVLLHFGDLIIPATCVYFRSSTG